MAKSRFVYRGGDRTVDSVVRKSKQSGGLYDSYLLPDVNMYKAKEGECTVRILPPTWEDTEKWGDGWDIGVYLHYGVGPDNGAYLCLDKMKGEPCPVCEARRSAADEDEADQLKPSFRSLAWVIDRDDEKAGPLVWSLPITLFREINARSIDKKTNTPILVDDPEEGCDIIFNRAGTNLKTKYTAVEISRDPSPLHDNEKLQARWLEYITEHPLPDTLVYFEAEHIEKVLFGKVERRKADDDEEAPRSSRRRALATEADEEEAAPTSRRSSRAAAREEPEEDPPSRSSRRATRASEDEEEPSRPSSRRAARGASEEEPETEAPARSTRRRALIDEGADDEVPFEKPARGKGRSEPEPDEGEPEPVRTARASLSRLKDRARAS